MPEYEKEGAIITDDISHADTILGEGGGCVKGVLCCETTACTVETLCTCGGCCLWLPVETNVGRSATTLN